MGRKCIVNRHCRQTPQLSHDSLDFFLHKKSFWNHNKEWKEDLLQGTLPWLSLHIQISSQSPSFCTKWFFHIRNTKAIFSWQQRCSEVLQPSMLLHCLWGPSCCWLAHLLGKAKAWRFFFSVTLPLTFSFFFFLFLRLPFLFLRFFLYLRNIFIYFFINLIS